MKFRLGHGFNSYFYITGGYCGWPNISKYLEWLMNTVHMSHMTNFHSLGISCGSSGNWLGPLEFFQIQPISRNLWSKTFLKSWKRCSFFPWIIFARPGFCWGVLWTTFPVAWPGAPAIFKKHRHYNGHTMGMIVDYIYIYSCVASYARMVYHGCESMAWFSGHLTVAEKTWHTMGINTDSTGLWINIQRRWPKNVSG